MLVTVKKHYLSMLASGALLFGSSLALAQKSPQYGTSSNENSAQTVTSDAQFARNADQANLAEIKLGQLAEAKGTTPTVKDFGTRMVTDHSKAEGNLKMAAEKDNIQLPATLSSQDQAAYDRLSKLSGEAFDRAYARDMVRDHTADVAQFRHEAIDGKDKAIQSFASNTLPTLRTHLQLAHQMLSATSAKSSSAIGRKNG